MASELFTFAHITLSCPELNESIIYYYEHINPNSKYLRMQEKCHIGSHYFPKRLTETARTPILLHADCCLLHLKSSTMIGPVVAGATHQDRIPFVPCLPRTGNSLKPLLSVFQRNTFQLVIVPMVSAAYVILLYPRNGLQYHFTSVGSERKLLEAGFNEGVVPNWFGWTKQGTYFRITDEETPVSELTE